MHDLLFVIDSISILLTPGAWLGNLNPSFNGHNISLSRVRSNHHHTYEQRQLLVKRLSSCP